MTSIICFLLAGNEQTANLYLKIQKSKMENLDFSVFGGTKKKKRKQHHDIKIQARLT